MIMKADPPPRRGRGRPRDAGADRAILKAALELFIERGVEGTSIEQIAKRAGVGKLTVYRRWSSKDELLSQAIESAREQVPDAPPEDLSAAPLADLVNQALPAQVDMMADPKFAGMIAQIFGSRATHPTLMKTYWEHYIDPRRRAVHVLLRRAQAEGQLDPEADLDVVIDMMVGALIYRMLQPSTPDRAEIRRYLEEVYRHAGLLPKNRSRQ
jgi:AcrR family transcriptional regulator